MHALQPPRGTVAEGGGFRRKVTQGRALEEPEGLPAAHRHSGCRADKRSYRVRSQDQEKQIMGSRTRSTFALGVTAWGWCVAALLAGWTLEETLAGPPGRGVWRTRGFEEFRPGRSATRARTCTCRTTAGCNGFTGTT